MATKLVVNLGEAERIPLGEGRQFLVGANMIAVFRARDGGVYATQASCSHRSGPLADGLVGDRKIVCPLHSYAFDLGSGKPLGHSCEALKTYSASVNGDGDVVVEVDRSTGFVYLVGAGPGDPDLITMKGLRCIGTSDVILHDRLIHPRLLAKARSTSIVINVGKRPGFEDDQQKAIHSLMIDYAQQGKTVCRLKGGDPFVFGRGGEEIQALVRAGISCEVVPGVSSAIAAPAAAGIPITTRGHGHAFMVIAASAANDFSSAEWTAAKTLVAGGGSLVVMMGAARLATIASYLLDGGCPRSSPIAVISRATWPDEHILFGDLGTISQAAPQLQTPAVLVAGSVVGIGRELQSMVCVGQDLA